MPGLKQTRTPIKLFNFLSPLLRLLLACRRPQLIIREIYELYWELLWEYITPTQTLLNPGMVYEYISPLNHRRRKNKYCMDCWAFCRTWVALLQCPVLTFSFHSLPGHIKEITQIGRERGWQIDRRKAKEANLDRFPDLQFLLGNDCMGLRQDEWELVWKCVCVT